VTFLCQAAEESLFQSPPEANTVAVLQGLSDPLLLTITSDLDSIMEGVNLSSSKYGCSHGRKKLWQ